MSLPSIVSYGTAAKTSSLVWDGDLVIPDGYAIESASGEVGIVGDVSISGSLSTAALTSDTITANETITSLGNTVINNKPLVVGENVGNASVTLTQVPDGATSYTSPDFAITGAIEDVQYIVPAIQHRIGTGSSFTTTFSIQAKLSGGAYQTLSNVRLSSSGGQKHGYTQAALTPIGTTALRYTISATGSADINEIATGLTLALTPNPVY